jgi:hypothetical protein
VRHIAIKKIILFNCLEQPCCRFFLKTPDKFFSDMQKSANLHMKHTFFKWFLHNRKMISGVFKTAA